MQCHREEAETVIFAHSHYKGVEKERKKECKKLHRETIIDAASTTRHPSGSGVGGAHFVN